jgi:Zn-dependent membrane protease YugP
MYFDPVYLLFVGPAMVLAFVASMMTKGRFKKWSQVPGARGLSGADTARYILDVSNLRDVGVEPSRGGMLSDHYDPRDRVVRLSPEVYGGRSVASLAVAAHEVGHAIQHRDEYGPMALRTLAVPMATLGSNLAYIVFFIGLAMQAMPIAWLGVLLFGGVVFFQLITLPVELDASARAKSILWERGLVLAQEREGVSKVLNAAALTYVAAALTSILTLFYFLMRLGVFGGGRRND